MFGNKVSGYEGRPRSVVDAPDRSVAGNVILRVGQENPDGSWHRTEHVVLAPEEARTFAAAVLVAADGATDVNAPLAMQVARLAHAMEHVCDHIEALQDRTGALEDRVSALTDHVVDLHSREEVNPAT